MGVRRIKYVGWVCVFNNNPWAGAPRLRDEGMAMLRDWAAGRGIPIVGLRSYPPPGEHQAGYTAVLVLVADDSQEAEIVAQARAIAAWEQHYTEAVSPA